MVGSTGNHSYETMTHRMDQIKPTHCITREECQEMIDDAIRKHNRNAGIISMCVGWVVLALFAEGLLRLIGVIPPILPWMKIAL
jgi:hypothetical protein